MNFLRYCKQGGKGMIWCAFLLFGALILLFWQKSPTDREPKDDRLPDNDVKLAMEAELTGLLSHMDGVSDVRVSVSLENGNEYTYEGGKTTVVTAGRVRGVAVVCQGGEDAVVRERIVSLVCALFDLPVRAVSVTG